MPIHHSKNVQAMTDEERVHALRAACALLERVFNSLDRRETTCDHCHRQWFKNWSEHLMAEPLKAMLKKLDRFAEIFAMPPEKRQNPPQE